MSENQPLSNQIDEVLPDLPPYLADNVDAIRQVGNFAAHPIKSERTGEIAEVEPHEAKWLLDVLEELFQFYYVVPKIAEKKRNDLNEKLEEIDRPPLKEPPEAD